MASQSEVGHAKNAAQFRLLLTHCQTFPEYNPANPAIGLAGLQAALAEAENALHDLRAVKTAYDNATNQREVAFAGLASFGTRVVNALEAAGALPQTVNDAMAVLRRLRGQSRRRGKTPEEAQPQPQPAAPEEGAPPAAVRRISTSQRSYDQQAEHFSKLVQVVLSEPLYTPNEAELSVQGLQARLAALGAATAAVQQGIAAYDNAIIRRNGAFYAPGTGLIPRALDVKKYVRSLYGSTSPHFRTVTAIAFRNIK